MSLRGLPRLCIVNSSLPPSYGGAEIAAYRYAERYHAAGGQVLLVGPIGEHTQLRSLPSWVVPIPAVRNGATASNGGDVPGSGLLRTGTSLWSTIWSLRHRFDVLHIFNSAPLRSLSAVPAARFCRKPVVLEMSLRGSDDPLRLRQWSPPGRIPVLRRPPVRYAYFRMANRFVAKSDILCTAFLEAGLRKEKLVRIPYGVNERQYRPIGSGEKQRLRERLGLEGAEVLILFVGSLNPRKGVHWLLEAFSRLPEELPARLVIVGPARKFPEYADSLREQVNTGGQDRRVTFVTQTVTNVDEYMQACDVFVLPSVREGLPIAVLEAMSSGMAIVASDIPEIARSQIRNGVEGILFPRGDVEALTSALTRLVEDPISRRQFGAASRQRVEREFATGIVDEQYRHLYAEILGGMAGGGNDDV